MKIVTTNFKTQDEEVRGEWAAIKIIVGTEVIIFVIGVSRFVHSD
jgi:hypothetical protein